MNAISNFLDALSGQVVVTTALGIALLSTAVILYCLRKQNALLQQVNKLTEDLRIANRGAIGMGQQIIALEKKLQRMSADAKASSQEEAAASASSIDMSQFSAVMSKQEKESENQSASIEDQNIDAPNSSYSENDKLSLARDLLEKGKALTEVANTCKLSFAEVSLLRALNSSSSSSNQPHAH